MEHLQTKTHVLNIFLCGAQKMAFVVKDCKGANPSFICVATIANNGART